MSDVGLIDELVLADGSLPRFVYWNNELHALPSRLGEIAKFKLLSRTFIFVLCNNVILLCFLSVKGKLRAALGLLGIIKAKPKGDYEESIQEFATRHLGWFYLRHANASIHFHVVVHHSQEPRSSSEWWTPSCRACMRAILANSASALH
jgi:hypothetical protein